MQNNNVNQRSLFDFCSFTINMIIKEGVRVNNNLNQKHSLIICLTEFLDMIPLNVVFNKM